MWLVWSFVALAAFFFFALPVPVLGITFSALALATMAAWLIARMKE